MPVPQVPRIAFGEANELDDQEMEALLLFLSEYRDYREHARLCERWIAGDNDTEGAP